MIPSNCGFLQVMFFPCSFSPFMHPIFSLNHWLPFADDVVIGHPYGDFQGIFIMSNALKYIAEWPQPQKMLQCMYILMGNAVTNPDLKATINRNSLSTVESVTYLGDTFAINTNRTNYFERILRKRVRRSIFCKETWKAVNAC